MRSILYTFFFLILLNRMAVSCGQEFIEQKVSIPNSLRIMILLTISSVNLVFYTPESCIIDSVGQMLNKGEETSDSFPESADTYLGLSIYLLDEASRRKSDRYQIYGGYINKVTETGSIVLIDPGRKLERFLLKIADQSKVIDTLNFHRPLSLFIPDSLFNTAVNKVNPRSMPIYFQNTYGKNTIFDLSGRKRDCKNPPLNKTVSSALFIIRYRNNNKKSTLFLE